MRTFVLLALTFAPTLLMQGEELPTSFILSTEKSTYAVGEPIKLTFTFTNEREAPIRGYFSATFDNSELKVYYRKDGGPFIPYYSRRMEIAETADMFYLPIPIPAHGQISHSELLLYDIKTELLLPIHKQVSEKWIFDQPGEYEFQAKFWLRPLKKGDYKVLESNIVRVTVIKPSKVDEEALALWKDKDIALAIQGDGFTPKAIDKLSIFLERFPTSSYTSYARERSIGYLTEKAKQGQLTAKEKTLYESLR
jgi:hypothetical protein